MPTRCRDDDRPAVAPRREQARTERIEVERRWKTRVESGDRPQAHSSARPAGNSPRGRGRASAAPRQPPRRRVYAGRISAKFSIWPAYRCRCRGEAGRSAPRCGEGGLPMPSRRQAGRCRCETGPALGACALGSLLCSRDVRGGPAEARPPGRCASRRVQLPVPAPSSSARGDLAGRRCRDRPPVVVVHSGVHRAAPHG